MRLHITPDLMEAAYEYFRLTPPFSRWKLPAGDEVEFVVTRKAIEAGHCRSTYDRPSGRWQHEIAVSAKGVKRTHNLFEIMAHEMVHAHCDRLGIKTQHGAQFRKFCDQIARYHGFNPMQF